MIADFADRLCKDIPLEGHGDTLELAGNAKAELAGIIRKLANLGIDGAIKYQDSDYEGLLQKDLVTALKDSTNCRLQIWNDLKDKLISSSISSQANKTTPPVSDFQSKSTYPDLSGVYSGHVIARVSGDIYKLESPQGTWHWVGSGIYWNGFMLGVGRFTNPKVPGRSFFVHMDMRGSSVIFKMVYLTDGSSEATLNNLPSGIRVDQHLLHKH